MKIVQDQSILPYCWRLIHTKDESVQGSAILIDAFNKIKRNLIRLVHPDKLKQIKGVDVDEQVVKKDFETASVAINAVLDLEVSWLRVDGRGKLAMPNSEALDNEVRQSRLDAAKIRSNNQRH
jgi:hypothetical protein